MHSTERASIVKNGEMCTWPYFKTCVSRPFLLRLWNAVKSLIGKFEYINFWILDQADFSPSKQNTRMQYKIRSTCTSEQKNPLLERFSFTFHIFGASRSVARRISCTSSSKKLKRLRIRIMRWMNSNQELSSPSFFNPSSSFSLLHSDPSIQSSFFRSFLKGAFPSEMRSSHKKTFASIDKADSLVILYSQSNCSWRGKEPSYEKPLKIITARLVDRFTIV